MSSIPRQVAQEFGYTNAAIDYCLKEDYNMNSGDLLDKLWLLDDGGLTDVSGKYNFEIYSTTKKNHNDDVVEEVEKRKNSSSLLHNETLTLYLKTICIKCTKQKRSILSFLCGCFVECTTCSSDIWFGCKQPVIDTLYVFQ